MLGAHTRGRMACTPWLEPLPGSTSTSTHQHPPTRACLRSAPAWLPQTSAGFAAPPRGSQWTRSPPRLLAAGAGQEGAGGVRREPAATRRARHAARAAPACRWKAAHAPRHALLNPYLQAPQTKGKEAYALKPSAAHPPSMRKTTLAGRQVPPLLHSSSSSFTAYTKASTGPGVGAERWRRGGGGWMEWGARAPHPSRSQAVPSAAPSHPASRAGAPQTHPPLLSVVPRP